MAMYDMVWFLLWLIVVAVIVTIAVLAIRALVLTIQLQKLRIARETAPPRADDFSPSD